jgi:hypothetical protein
MLEIPTLTLRAFLSKESACSVFQSPEAERIRLLFRQECRQFCGCQNIQIQSGSIAFKLQPATGSTAIS